MKELAADVLIVGGGLAGLRAAIAAVERGVSVLVVSKSEVALDNCTASAAGYLSGAVGDTSPEQYLKLLQERSGGLADEGLQRALAYDSGPALAELQRFGIDYETTRGHVVVSGPYLWVGRSLTEPLYEFALHKGVQFFSGICLDHLLMAQGQCCGAGALDLSTGETMLIRAKATVLCGGGHAAVFPRHDNPGSTMGDCVEAACSAGACCRQMECIKFHSLGLAEGPEPQDGFNFAPVLGKGQLMCRDGTPVERDELSGLWKERARPLERDDERFDLWLDNSQVDWSEPSAARIRQSLLEPLDACDRPVRVSPLAHYTPGGICIDAQGQTNVPYLFAAGECTGGVFGADRPGGAALTECVVFARRAGHEAGRQALSRAALPQVQAPQIAFGDGPDPTPLLDRARWLVWNYASVHAYTEGLEQCAGDLEDIARRAEQISPATAEAWLVLRELRSVLFAADRIIATRLGQAHHG